jgi:galactokinase
MTGGGFGGCAVCLVKSELAQAIGRKISEAYERKTRIEPMIFTSRPAAGARVLQG